MALDAVKRRLSAILSADVVGYSRLMGEDEVVTVQTIESYRKTISALVEQHRGRIIDTPGDNILSEFASVVDAVQCAIEIQYVIKAKNTVVPETRRMEYRIGISLEDIIEEGDRIYGDGVNIAARIESLADGGGICISGRAYDHIASKLALRYEDMGDYTLKNISMPVRVYRIPLQAEETSPSGGLQLGQHSGKPVIAVLAFHNMSSDPEQDFFSEGISEDILNGLANSSGVDVIARTSSFRFKEEDRDIRDIGEQLRATHVLEGSIRKYGNRIRVTAQLIDTTSGTHVFSEQYDRELSDVFAMQDELAAAILQRLNIHLLGPVRNQRHTADMDAYNAYLMARNCVYSGLLDRAVEYHGRAVSLDPDYSTAHGALAGTHNSYIWWSRRSWREQYPVICGHMDKALSLDPQQPDARYVRAEIRFFGDRAYQEAIDEMSSLVRMYPNSISILMHYGFLFQTLGRTDLTARLFDRILMLDPLNPTAHLLKGTLFLREGRFSASREAFGKMDMLGLHEPGMLAELALCQDDAQGIRDQLSHGQANWGNLSDWYPFYEAAALYLEGNREKAEGRFKRLQENAGDRYSVSLLRSFIATIQGDIEVALRVLSEDLSEIAYTKFRDIQMPCFFSRSFPDYRSHTGYQKLLTDSCLDSASVDRLEIPALPF